MKAIVIDYSLDREYHREVFEITKKLVKKCRDVIDLIENEWYYNSDENYSLQEKYVEEINEFLRKIDVHISDNIIIEKLEAPQVKKALRYLIVIRDRSGGIAEGMADIDIVIC